MVALAASQCSTLPVILEIGGCDLGYLARRYESSILLNLANHKPNDIRRLAPVRFDVLEVVCQQFANGEGLYGNWLKFAPINLPSEIVSDLQIFFLGFSGWVTRMSLKTKNDTHIPPSVT